MPNRIAAIIMCALGVSAPLAANAADSSATAAVIGRVHELLNAYATKDTAHVMAIFDTRTALFMGADLREVATTRPAVEALLHDDFALWDRAEFGRPEHLSITVAGAAASAFFDVPFTAYARGGSRTMTIRVATNWVNRNGTWRVTQVLDTVPTVGQSAAELLKK